MVYTLAAGGASREAQAGFGGVGSVEVAESCGGVEKVVEGNFCLVVRNDL